MKTKPFHPALVIEPLEFRISPATISLVEGTFVFNAGTGIANNLTFNIVGANIVITDSAETIALAGAAGFSLSNGNHTATGPAGGVSSIALNMGDQTDAVTILATDDQLNIMGDGTLNVNIGGTSGTRTAKNIKNIVSVFGGPGADSVRINAADDVTAANVTLSSGGIGGGVGDTIFGAGGQVGLSGVQAITVETGSTASAIKILSTAADTTTSLTSASGGHDTVTIGSNGSVQDILGAISITNPPSFTTLILDNSADASGRTVAITSTSVTGLAPAAINFSDPDVQSLTVLTGTGADTFNVSSLQTAVNGLHNTIDGGGGDDVFNVTGIALTATTTLTGGTGDDTFNIGNAGNLQGLVGPLTIQGGGDTDDALFLNDAATAGTSTYTITASTIGRTGFGTLTFSGVPKVTLDAQTGANSFNIRGVASGTVLTLNGNGGDDLFTLGVPNGSLSEFLGSVAIDAGATFGDQVNLVDINETTGHIYSFDGSQFVRDTLVIISSLANAESFSLNMGSGNDVFDGRSSTHNVTINAGAGDDLMIGTPLPDSFIGGPGTDTVAELGIAGDATVTNSGITSGAFINTFPSMDIEIVKLSGDAGKNVFDASAFTGLALLDGVSGKDTITGSDVTFAAKSVSFKDAEGDTVTIKTSKGHLGPEHLFVAPGANGLLLQRIDLHEQAQFKGSALSITAKASASGGDSFVNVGYVDAFGVDLASLTVGGDLGRLVAGDLTAATPGLGKLVVTTLFAFSTDTQELNGETTAAVIGKLGSLTVKGAFGSGGRLQATGVGIPELGSIGAVTIGGNLLGQIQASGNIASVKVLKAVSSGEIQAGGTIGTVNVSGDFVGIIAAATGAVFAPTSQAKSVAIKSVTIGGDVRFSGIYAGGTGLMEVFNADASIGSITVKGAWIQSSVSAGASSVNAFFGDGDDQVGVGKGGDFDSLFGGNPAIVSTIASITIKGQVSGTFPTTNGTDRFGFVAQAIGSFKLGSAKLGLTKNVTNTPIGIGPTGDVIVREV